MNDQKVFEKDTVKEAKTELRDDDLDQVAGGVGVVWRTDLEQALHYEPHDVPTVHDTEWSMPKPYRR